ncbi:ral GTPase-activating protein subunit beta-like isoform X2 [Sphaeramia orbicularis]|uniref:ral GTPase-activating protein subunit beta-like isoform X2 n=1 Tax=Sphaeramia orbicularis TaxID=375764 RepID=UPI001180D156|nr:ral GTPase-activating protein subunit beta-like isoform X2 [Sphaeramia orbicularis]
MDQSLSSWRPHASVLSCFPPSVGRDVAVAVVKSLAVGLGNPNTQSLLRTDGQVKWTMEVLCFGLTLPLDGDTVRLCVDVYTDWLKTLFSQRDSIPPPIRKEPDLYAQKILRHLYSLFLPRSDQVSPLHLSLCQQVLCAVQSMARDSVVMSRDTWETLLHFLLRINHLILVLPLASGASDLSHLSLSVLLEVWLLSAARCFPSRSLWQTCRQMFNSWRHQPIAVETWSRVTAALTSRLLSLTYGPLFPPFKVPDEDAALVPTDLDDERIPLTWFRFLHMFSNPVELCRPPLIGRSGNAHPPPPQDEAFWDSQLPNIFLKVMSGVSRLVDAFLGLTENTKEPTEDLLLNTGLTSKLHPRDRLPSLGIAVTRSPFKDRLPAYGMSRPRSGSAPPTPVTLLSMPSGSTLTSSPPVLNRRQKAANISKWRCPPSPSPLRSDVDSLLHLFGRWLFDAALMGSSQADSWSSGRAEACGTLCRIFTCKKTSEDILPVYLSRFYLILRQTLQISEGACPLILASVLLNSSCLFCCDLTGVNLLLPTFTAALEDVLLDRDLLRFPAAVNPVELRRSSILILLSLLPLPLQFGSVQSELPSDRHVSFLSLKPRLLSILIGGLQTENDVANTHLILAAMLNLVQDSAVIEAAGRNQKEPDLGPVRDRRATAGTRQTTVQADSAVVMWVQFVRLLTQRLTSQWRNDSAVCLSALEVLGGLAKVEVSVEESEKRRAVSSVCSYIVFQCSRPPPLHSRDLHSIITAAFHCLNVWITQHPDMLNHQDCLVEVLEIVELGISGSISRQEEKVRCKEEKELNPASLRVKEAAEATLSCVMQVSGAFPLLGGLLNEDALIGGPGLSDSSVKRFRYFVVDGSVILAMLEKPQNTDLSDQASCPSLTVLIRGPSGRHSWTLQLHLQPREGRGQSQSPEPKVPEHHGAAAPEDAGIQCNIKHQEFPEYLDRVPPVKADLSLPGLRETANKEVQRRLDQVRAVLKRQRQVEAQPQMSGTSVAMTTCRSVVSGGPVQTARLFLSHLGLLTPDTLKDSGGVPAQLLSLDSSLPGFSEDLRHLDQLASRNCDSASVFYLRAGQRTAAEVLSNADSSSSVSSHFLDFLSSLGCPVAVSRTSPVSADFPESPAVPAERRVLMYTDALTEITFIVPSLSHGHSPQEVEPNEDSSPLSTSPVADGPSSPHWKASSSCSQSKIWIVWVERFEDIDSFPLNELLSPTRTETSPCAVNIQLIFIHPLKTGLFRIRLYGNKTSKFSLVVPLVSGSVVSKRTLGFLVRETVINCCYRRRLDSDSAPPPHVRRKHMISDIIQRYRSHCSEPTFYTALFQDV